MRKRSRVHLPQPTERLSIGTGGCRVSPFCLGITSSPEVVLHAYETGINFFFLSGDLHWPLYAQTRRGISRLLREKLCKRDDIVVGVVSYLENPWFSGLQFQEVIDSTPGLERVDLLVAGGVSGDGSCSRFSTLLQARASSHLGSTCIGASFHSRRHALQADHLQILDIAYVRYNTGHPSAECDLFPHLSQDSANLLYNFKSMNFRVTSEQLQSKNLAGKVWVPDAADYYRFALSEPSLDGILCSPSSIREVDELTAAMTRGPLSAEIRDYLVWLSSIVYSISPDTRQENEVGEAIVSKQNDLLRAA